MSTHRLPLLATSVALLISLPARADAPTAEAPGFLIVTVPEAAKLLIASTPTRLTGTERRFETPPLKRGKVYRYELIAIVTEAGKKREIKRSVEVRAGETTRVDMDAVEPPAALSPAPKPPVAVTTSPRTRAFLFTYETKIVDVPKAETADVWLPIPPSTNDQFVEPVSPPPDGATTGQEREYGNKMMFLRATPAADGTVSVSMTYRVKRLEVRGLTDLKSGEEADAADGRVARFLKPDTKVPIDGKPLELIQGKPVPSDPTQAARLFYDVVNRHMRYDKSGTGWGEGDSNWACDSKYGNCTDFHSLFISLARSRKIPAKFEIGFPLPAARGEGQVSGYHCWAWFRAAAGHWIPVDISEANKAKNDPAMVAYYFGNLTEDRVTFTTGRDITLVPKQQGAPLNYFVYPYVEVGGKPYPKAKIKNHFAYKDVAGK